MGEDVFGGESARGRGVAVDVPPGVAQSGHKPWS